MKLSDLKAKSAKSRDKAYKLTDGDGLYLLVQPSGSKLWRFDYRIGGKRKTISFGKYPEVTLAAARDKRLEARMTVSDGIDPSEYRQAAKAEAKAARIKADEEADPTPREDSWQVIATEYRDKRKREGVSPLTLSKLDWLLEKTWPALGELRVSDIGVSDLLPVLRAIEAEGAHETARRLRSVCGRVFRYAIATGRAERDVAHDISGALTAPNVKHRPGLTNPQAVGELMRRIEGYSGDPLTKAALQFLAYTFVRNGELRALRWDDVDLKEARIVIPAERMKMRRAHIVPLAPRVVALLDAVKKLTSGGKLVFASRLSPGRPLSENTANQALRRLGYDTATEHCAHGFRTTASTLLNELGWNRDWIERQLAHVEGNEVRRAYNAAEYLEDRKRMMHWWADYLDKVGTAL